MGWLSAATLMAFAVGAVVLVGFVMWERRVKEPMLDMSYFRNPAFSTGTGGMMLLFLSMYGVMFLLTQYFQLVLGLGPLAAALRVFPMAPIMMIVSPLTPRLSKRFGTQRIVAFGMFLIALGFVALFGIGLGTGYLYVLGCIFLLISGVALAMGPMTASIMSAVPPRRAGAGSATNDATRELGAALGIAVLGSVAASRYSAGLTHLLHGLSASAQSVAKGSLAGALRIATTLPAVRQVAFVLGSKQAFLGGIHLAVLAGAILALVSAGIVLRFLPRVVEHGQMSGPLEAAENAAELGLAGVLPLLEGEPPAFVGADGDGAAPHAASEPLDSPTSR